MSLPDSSLRAKVITTVSPSSFTWLAAVTIGVSSLSKISISMLDLYNSAFWGLDKVKVNDLSSSSSWSSVVIIDITPTVSPAEITKVPLEAW